MYGYFRTGQYKTWTADYGLWDGYKTGKLGIKCQLSRKYEVGTVYKTGARKGEDEYRNYRLVSY